MKDSVSSLYNPIRYIGETIDSLKNYKSNKEKRTQAEQELAEFLENYQTSKLPPKPQLDEVPEYERMNYDAPDDDEIQRTAESELAYYKAQGEKGVDSQSEAERRKYNAEQEAAAAERERAAAAAESSYAEAKQNVDNDMLKRGLARSSIAANKKAELENGEAAAKTEIEKSYGARIAQINEQISALDSKREQALNDFNLAYAAKLTQRIGELKAERAEREAETIKYNNTLAQKEHEQKVDKAVKEDALYKSALSQKKTESEMQNLTSADYEKIYAVIAQTLRTMNMHDARNLVLNDPRIAQSLSPQYYYKLYSEFCR